VVDNCTQPNMAVVNVSLNNMLNVKDSRWLQLEVCREFQRSKCSRSDSECKFAHPPANVEVQNGRVIACYDSIKVSHAFIVLWADYTVWFHGRFMEHRRVRSSWFLKNAPVAMAQTLSS